MKLLAPLLLVAAFLVSDTFAQPWILKGLKNILKKNKFVKKFVGIKTERSDGKPWFCHDLDCPNFRTVRKMTVDEVEIEERCYEVTEWVRTTQDGDKKSSKYSVFLQCLA